MRAFFAQSMIGRALVLPVWDAIWRLSQPDVRIVTGGIAFYALFSVFPLIYLTSTLLFALLPADLSAELASAINSVITTNVVPLTEGDMETVVAMRPTNITLKVALALILVLWAAMAGAKAMITGIRMIAGSDRRSGLIRFQGIAFILTAVLILLVWLLGFSQLVLTIVRNQDDGFALRFTSEIATIAGTIWATKWIAGFAVFYLILAVSLNGRISKGWPMLGGAAAAAVVWLTVTFGFQLYLKYSTLDTLYGALASVIIGFIWLALSVNTLLLGAALATAWDNKELKPDVLPDL
ncbi:YhjD/YihY/BrkB family envelope integrity protein [Hyphomonas sp. FCG-A18]|uniref:YihY/virulence factor BrkB family protein n=1 Tax=Hyphomonas sp. FCG-A18 TaxID=3080019 RepID=UPI002B2D66E3|nr:YhjD/YihY/BrkB family envelope integrity protein [Hyphomonas sp. FCG-A18]